jgi:hypothetical protein
VADESLEKLYRLRRQRDIVLRPGQTPPPLASWDASEESTDEDAAAEEAPVEDEGSETPEPPPVKIERWSDDPQLQRAIEHLREKLNKA